MRSISEELRHYAKLIEGQLLNEATDYNSMFNDIRTLLNQFPDPPAPPPLKSDFLPWFEQSVQQVIQNSRSVLKKDERIVWYLRYWKIGLIGNIMARVSGKLGAAGEERIQPFYSVYDKNVDALAKRSNITSDEVKDTANSLYRAQNNVMARFAHYFSLPIQAIQNYQFGNNSWTTIRDTLHQFEENWMEQTKGLFPYDPNDGETILKFDDGFFWVLLPRGACRQEGEAMGHCGNVPSQVAGDRILSLRKLVTQGKETFVRPSLTFILHEGGWLGEMKGRGNQKPKAEYHPHIVSLLKTDLITGIEGGGYAPQNNFSLSDLNDATRTELLKVKPELGSLLDYYKINGVTPDLITRMKKKYGLHYIDITFEHRGKVYGTLERYDNVFDFAEENYSGNSRDSVDIKYIIRTLRDGDFFDVYGEGPPDKETKTDILRKIPKHELIALGNFIVKNYSEKITEMDSFNPRDVDDIVEFLDNVDGDDTIDEINSAFRSAYSDGLSRGAENEMSDTFWKEIHNNPYLYSEDGGTVNYDTKVVVAAPIEEILKTIGEDEESWDYDSRWLFMPENERYKFEIIEPRYGWSGYDLEAAADSFVNNLPFPTSQYT